jgi:hypothetical protein
MLLILKACDTLVTRPELADFAGFKPKKRPFVTHFHGAPIVHHMAILQGIPLGDQRIAAGMPVCRLGGSQCPAQGLY